MPFEEFRYYLVGAPILFAFLFVVGIYVYLRKIKHFWGIKDKVIDLLIACSASVLSFAFALVSRQPHNVGYNLFSLILASSLVKRQS
ncbi:MAG: hypothetical protein KKH67_09920, partial [candidate division Zixibacteria bacterium]|nr:hypothetical protein [candidate division Zixibacteria bacterium]